MRIIAIISMSAISLVGGCCHCLDDCRRTNLEYDRSASVLALYGSAGEQIGVVRMARNTRYCRPVDDGKRLEYAPVILPPNPGAPTEYDYNENGWYRNGVCSPKIPDGKVVASVTYRYDEDENAVVADYEYEDAPKPVRTFSKLKLYGALMQAGLWESFEAWLKSQTINGMSAYTAFSLAQDLNDANPLFLGVVEQAKSDLHVSDEIVEQILEASIADM